MRNTIKAIPITYNGVTFRSKMEANFAKWCDQNKQKWIYEPEGLTNGKQCYLPDFYLPESKMIVEIKPVFFIKETYKLDMIMDCEDFDSFGLAVIEMAPDLHVIKYSPPGRDIEYETGEYERCWATPGEITCVGFCFECESFNINANFAVWTCTGCGFYDGDNTVYSIDDVYPQEGSRSRCVRA